jgi:hypothetical protein
VVSSHSHDPFVGEILVFLTEHANHCAGMLHLILLALHANLGEAQAKLDATAAARTLNLPDPVKDRIWADDIFRVASDGPPGSPRATVRTQPKPITSGADRASAPSFHKLLLPVPPRRCSNSIHPRTPEGELEPGAYGSPYVISGRTELLRQALMGAQSVPNSHI